MSEFENESKQSSERTPENEKEKGDLEKVPDRLEELDPGLKKVIEASVSMQRISSSSLVSPVYEKINEKHIDKILEISEKDDERAFADSQSARKYSLINLVIVLVFFGGLTVFLVNKDVAVYQEILKIIIIFGGGFGSGFGFKGYVDRKNK